MVRIYGPNPANAQDDVLRPFPLMHFTAAVGTMSQNAVYIFKLPQVAAPFLVTRIGYGVGTAAGNVDAGLCTRVGTDYTRVASAGSTAAAGSNVMQDLTMTTPYVYQPGQELFVTWSTDSATITILRLNAVFGAWHFDDNAMSVKTSAWSSGIPASIATPAATATAIALRLS